MSSERLIKTRKRVQQHGEVFTPVKIVRDMLSLDGIKDKVKDIRATILEPSVGEGIFLVEILKIRTKIILKKATTITEYENNSLLALSTLYGIELLEDNAQKCCMNLYDTFLYGYDEAISRFATKRKEQVRRSASTIIAANIQQGDFLSKLNSRQEPIIFSEWKELSITKVGRIKVVRTEYTLQSMYEGTKNEDGCIIGDTTMNIYQDKQLSLFDFLDGDDNDEVKSIPRRYIPCYLMDVYQEETEDYEG